MTWKAGGAVAMVLLTLPVPLLAEAPPGLAIRIYNNVGLAADDLRVATLEAEHILRAAGITVSFVECWYRDAEPAMVSGTCRQPSGANALTLRLPAAAAASAGTSVSMGYSLVQLHDRAPFLATVYSDLVGSVARSARIDPRPLLGRAIAHEIGHLLLNTTRHADAGLMRETWTRLELQKNDPADWEFRNQDTLIMQAAVSARLSEASR